ncbi:hypothetical protein HAX54_045789 [Datura stramonium]|uniref:Uncharacterized protein n=1 Tax=Datura stramonium TaxID=4076 RepID=A0ABS8WJY5_DATST|nr:hypothetical protein [Datura stramonium]
MQILRRESRTALIRKVKMNPLRTSHPRTGKHSDPKYKGKRMEKRPAKEEAEFASNSELEEALQKAKEDKERKAAQKYQKAIGPLRLRPCLEQVKVRGVEVDYNAKAINQAYFDEDDADAIEYFAKLENQEDYYTWIASLIAAATIAVARNAQQGLRDQPPINSGRILGPMEEPKAEEINDEEESLPKLVVANKLVVINVEPDETEKHHL